MVLRLDVRGRVKRRAATLAGRFAHQAFRRAYRLKAGLDRYHNPIPILGYAGVPQNAAQGSAATQKIDLILATLPPSVRTASDIGGNTGAFSAALARRGVFTYYFEPDGDLFSIGFLEAHAAPAGFIAVSRLAVDADTIELLPTVDCTLFLSVMHYWVERHGWEKALQLLGVIWERTRQVLYFEIPNPVQNTKMARVLAAMGRTDFECETFIRNFLGALPGARVELLDYLFTDFRPDERRHLFAVTRA